MKFSVSQEQNYNLGKKEREIESGNLAEAVATALKETSRMEHWENMNMMQKMVNLYS